MFLFFRVPLDVASMRNLPSPSPGVYKARIFTMTFDSTDELYKIRRALDDRVSTEVRI